MGNTKDTRRISLPAIPNPKLVESMTIDRQTRFNRIAIGVEEARQKLIESAVPTEQVEYVPLSQSLNRSLAVDLSASVPVPHFARSGLDGYALRAEDVSKAEPAKPVILRIVGEVAAGDLPERSIGQGEAMRVMTGAAVPEGASAVVMFEQTEEFNRDGQPFVQIKRSADQGQHIAYPGEEMHQGQRLIHRGTRIQPGQIALLAAFGHERVPVIARPKVAIFATGRELLPAQEPLVAGRIRNSNSPMVTAQVALAGGEPRDYGILPDDPLIVGKKIIEALQDNDLVITTGGVSVGDHDAIAALFGQNSDFQLLFNKVALRPGSPTSAALARGKLVIGLSGNPGACFVGFELFVKPVLLHMLSSPPPLSKTLDAVLAEPFGKGSPYDRYVRAKLQVKGGMVHALPLGFGKSGMMVSIPEADGLIVIPAGGRGADKDEIVQVIPLRYETST